ncbi:MULTISPECIES: YihY/virulence factor BrkB family protein [unclassified Modestobacter]|uniref:YihY/virulence factor BrkB family protein n=1 Tax=unclassified Modestobacter TaxID=2643866 RepID=UPI0022AB33A4|nr:MULTISPECIES: YhjD/YihY/BrkB family envelope integrity protein [unclassified Modestobacter]MCZ2826552.1 YihY/virulence factor BrkB family protein [Modestobacter sp. VKM Ac-2981]MCZ2854932.1 YihY/virulence factor BrkB family protein [Modestobacter sp. VKM Ac-2982]
MSVVEKLDRLQRRRRAAGFPIAVVYKYVDDSGPYLSALITYYAFVSLFPLLLLFSTILSNVLVDNPELQQRLLDSAVSQLPVVGEQLGEPRGLSGGVLGVIVGILGSLYGALGVAQAIQYAMNTAWAVPRNSRPNPFLARGLSLLLVATAGLAVIGTTALATFTAGHAGSMGGASRVLTVLGSVLINAAVFVFAFRLATARPLTIRQVLPGAFLAAVVWQLLQTFGVTYVSRVMTTASATNGVFALVLGLLAFLYLAAVVGVLCVEINVVRVNRLWPRALLTPFTDDVDLTPGDRRSYTGMAKAQRTKGFETVHVTFDPPDRTAD